MTDGRRDLISRQTRRAFRDLSTDVVVRAIAEYWEDQRFTAVEDPSSQETSVRRRKFDEYANQVDWSDLDQVDRALRVFEHILRFFHREANFQPGTFDEVRGCLDEDGLRLDDHYKIAWHSAPGHELSGIERNLTNLTDASGIRVELERARRHAPSDPAAAIGAAKQLIEATAKVVLNERGIAVDGNAKVPALIKQAQEALRLHPSQTTAGPDGTDPVKKILGGVSAIAIGVAELRNLGYGTGHGQASAPTGLGVRHAHLAVYAAITWCKIILDTLDDPNAPWRKTATAAASGN